MTAAHYKNHRELAVSPQTQKDLMNAVENFKAVLCSFGMNKTAVDMISISLKEYTLSIGDDETRGGAFHVYADGKPFYEMRISAPGTLHDVDLRAKKFSDMDDWSQAWMACFEMCMNALPGAAQFLNEKYGVGSAHGGGGSPVMLMEFDTTFRCSPAELLDTITLALRLQGRLAAFGPDAGSLPQTVKKPPRP